MGRSLMYRPAMSPLRPANWTLRVSVLDRCQYRCAYCRPGSLAPYVAREERLSVDDYARLSPILASMGVTKIRFTGGEPLLRRDLAEVVAAFRAGLPEARLLLTTNGQHLAERLGALVSAGLTGATVHVDSLRPDRYRAIMGEGDVASVLDATLAARAHLEEVKLNVVVQRDQNDDEIGDFLAWSRATGVEVRFIELMNTGSAVEYTRKVFVSGREIVSIARRLGGATSIPRRHASDRRRAFARTTGWSSASSHRTRSPSAQTAIECVLRPRDTSTAASTSRVASIFEARCARTAGRLTHL